MKWYHKQFDKTTTHERKDKDKPIFTYYFNRISSVKDIYDNLEIWFKNEVKSFKILFQLSKVFETLDYDYENDEVTIIYEGRDVIWQKYQQSIPITMTTEENINEVRWYIKSQFQHYKTTSSNNKLTIVGSFSFTI